MIREDLLKKCNDFAYNYQLLKQNFKWEYTTMSCLGALLYTNADVQVDVDKIKQAKEIIKKNTGVFSAFKDTTFYAIAIVLSLEPNMEELFKKTLNIYKKLKDEGFYSSPYLTLAAFSVAKQTSSAEDHIDEHDVQKIISRAKEFYNAMKKEHRFLTSSDDYGYATMLAATDLSIPQAISEMESCFSRLKDKFGVGNALQSLTHVLTIGEEDSYAKCERVKLIYDSLKEKGCKLSKYNELATLGILVLITEDVEKLTDEISEVYQQLIDKKGFGSWSMSKHERTMYAIALVANEYIDNLQMDTISITLQNSLTSILIAQQTAMIIAATSACTAAAASSST